MSAGASIVVIEIGAPVYNCRVCDAELAETSFGGGFGVPMYEDEVLPNDWPGEWGGFPACRRCFDAQQTITRPIDIRQFRELVGVPG